MQHTSNLRSVDRRCTLAAAERLPGRPVSYVVNSHYHGNHIIGNQVFTGPWFFATTGTSVLKTARTLQEIAEAKSDSLLIWRKVEAANRSCATPRAVRRLGR
jgi:glyoxylase-like metal-dependent hydrolase (beta-lactamase superfamily II)